MDLPLSSTPLLLLFSAVFLLYKACVYTYRVTLSPLARFPGPKVAALTSLYEGYYDLIKDGQYPWRIRKMHAKYGPVVRINPREIHIMDSDYVDPFFNQRLDKDPWLLHSFGNPLAGFGTANHDLHRARRGAINRFFSKASIASRIDVIQAQILKLCDKLAPYAESTRPVHLDAGFICLTNDVIAQFCYGVCYNYLDVPGFDRNFKAMMENVFAAGAFNRQFPIIFDVMSALPVWVVMRLMPKISGILRLQEMVRAQAKRIVACVKDGKSNLVEQSDDESHSNTQTVDVSRKATVFNQILDSQLPDAEKSEERLVQEGQTLIAAGSETTARALSIATVHLLGQPLILARLRREMQAVMPTHDTKPSLAQLEKLPFLTAVIKESIRLGGSTVTRASRISPKKTPLQYKDWVFPSGTPVSMTLNDILTDETIFPSPNDFDPMRWLVAHTDSEGREELSVKAATDKHFVAFSRGPRSCVGMWLAWAELYMGIAHLFRRFDIELFETGIEEVATYCDRFSCFAKPGTKGVRARIMGLRA